MSMERIAAIRRHPRFQAEYGQLWAAEADRPFCRHGMEHLLSVARLMYLYSLEDQSGLPKDLLYAAALLHDIGRYEQISQGTPHHIAGARIAGEILPACGFTPEETAEIQAAILAHRAGDHAGLLAVYLYRGDKQSRLCFACKAEPECSWPDEKKNMQISN